MQPFLLVAVSFPATRVLKPTEQDLEYLTYDASYGVHVDEKSHTGTAITLGKGVVYDGPRLSARCCYDLPGKYENLGDVEESDHVTSAFDTLFSRTE